MPVRIGLLLKEVECCWACFGSCSNLPLWHPFVLESGLLCVARIGTGNKLKSQERLNWDPVSTSRATWHVTGFSGDVSWLAHKILKSIYLQWRLI